MSRCRCVRSRSRFGSHDFRLGFRLVCRRSWSIVVFLRRCLLGLRVLLRRKMLRLMLNRTRPSMWRARRAGRRQHVNILLLSLRLLEAVDRGDHDVVVVDTVINLVVSSKDIWTSLFIEVVWSAEWRVG